VEGRTHVAGKGGCGDMRKGKKDIRADSSRSDRMQSITYLTTCSFMTVILQTLCDSDFTSARCVLWFYLAVVVGMDDKCTQKTAPHLFQDQRAVYSLLYLKVEGCLHTSK